MPHPHISAEASETVQGGRGTKALPVVGGVRPIGERDEDPKGIGSFRPDCCVLGFHEIDATQVAVVGGKGAHLGELSRIEGIRVPPGFCVTTDAFRRSIAEAPSIDDRLDRLSRLHPDDREGIRTLRRAIEIDPGYVDPLMHIAIGRTTLFSNIWTEDPAAEIAAGRRGFRGTRANSRS